MTHGTTLELSPREFLPGELPPENTSSMAKQALEYEKHMGHNVEISGYFQLCNKLYFQHFNIFQDFIV